MDRNQRALAIFLGLCCSGANAQMVLAASDEDLMMLYGDEETISIATGTQKPIHLAPSVASVITANDFKELGITTLDEALEMVPGLHVSRDPSRLNAIYSMRGIHTTENPQVLLLINGIPVVNSVSGGRPPSYRLPVANISRIELIRGPGSAIYGADAFAGVINVITKDAHELQGGTVGIRAGSFNSRDGWVQYGVESSGWQSAVSLEFSKSDGDDGRVVTDANGAIAPLVSDYNVYNLNLDLRRDHWGLWFNSWANRGAGLGAGAARIVDPVGWQDTSNNTLKLRYNDNKLTPDWAVDSYLSYSKMKSDSYFRIYPPASTLPICADGGINGGNLYVPGTCTGAPTLVTFTDGLIGEPVGIVDNMIYEAAFTYSGFDKHTVRLAAGYKHDRVKAEESKNYGPGVIDGSLSPIGLSDMAPVTGTPYIYMPDSSRSVTYLSLQDGWLFAPDWELTAGLRYDNYSDFGNTTNPRLALVWAMDYNLTGKLLYGRAFRAPSFKELYFKNNPVLRGNPDVTPEKLDTVELVFDYRPTFDLTTLLNLFSYRAENLIQFVAGNAQNAKDQRGHGAELELIWNAVDKLELGGGFAWQQSEDANSGAVIADAPQRQLNLSARYRVVPSVWLSAKAKRVMDRPRATADSRAPLSDYTLVDVAARYTVNNTPWEFAVGINNLFDADAREPSPTTQPNQLDDLPLAGRGFHFEASYKF